ncbi:unnamed protein product [Pylaiella littoralis]
MQSRNGLAEVSFLLVLVAVGVAGFVSPLASNQQLTPLQEHHHDHAHCRLSGLSASSSARQPVALCRTSSRIVHVRPLSVKRNGDDSQRPVRDGIDTEGIEARGGDTEGIYGLAREIVEKEEAEAPFRRMRLIGYAVPAFIAIFLAGISLAGMAGIEEFQEVSENLPNPLIDAGIVGGAFYFWVEEVKTKRSSLALIKKRYEEESKVPNRGARRRKKSFGKKKASSKKAGVSAAAAAAVVATREQPSSSLETATEAAETEPPAAPKKGMFEGVKETLEAVNKQSYYQALALNKELEEKGVLPPLEREPSSSDKDEKEIGFAEEGSEPEIAAAAAAGSVAASAAGGAPAAAASPEAVGSTRQKKPKKSKKKGKRSK